jgi:hypothetical protein
LLKTSERYPRLAKKPGKASRTISAAGRARFSGYPADKLAVGLSRFRGSRSGSLFPSGLLSLALDQIASALEEVRSQR